MRVNNINVIQQELDSPDYQRIGIQWDICYAYFHQHRGNNLKNRVEAAEVLLTYLRKFGMTKRKAYYLHYQPYDLLPLIEFIASHPEGYNMSLDNYEGLITLYNGISERLQSNRSDLKTPSHTAVTKVMLGVYGCIPAFDFRFITAFKNLCRMHNIRPMFNGVYSARNLSIINDFYTSNQADIDALSSRRLRNVQNQEIDIHYPIARLIDCYGWHCGA